MIAAPAPAAASCRFTRQRPINDSVDFCPHFALYHVKLSISIYRDTVKKAFNKTLTYVLH